MPSFNELNTVEYSIIHKLTGVNLNSNGNGKVHEPAATYGAVPGAAASAGTCQWRYVPANHLKRKETDVLLEADVKDALIRLNPSIAAQPSRADEVIYKLRNILLAVHEVGLVGANEEFAKWVRGEKSMPFGNDGQHVTVRLLDFQDLTHNDYIATNQFHIRTGTETKIPDVVLFVNGIPLVVGEAKTPVRPAVTWLDGAYEVHEVYENAVTPLFVPNVLSFATEGKEFFYGAVRTPLEFWCPWRLEAADGVPADELAQAVGMKEVGKQLCSLLNPATLLDMLANFTLYATNSKKKKMKVVARYQQYEGANAIVDRVVDGTIRKGLLWHFQGSGKSLLMVFAAQKLRRLAALKSPTILIVVDRQDLDQQISGTFLSAEVANVVPADSIQDLRDKLAKDTRKVIITTIQKFQDAPQNLNLRDNIIVLCDEAHRTQEGDLGVYMREALPNAFFFGLTGTPINKRDQNTFATFGSETDEGGYLSRYTFQESIADKQTLELHFEPRLPEVHVDKEKLDAAFAELAERANLSEADQNTLSKRAANLIEFQKAPQRVHAIAEDIVQHFQTHVEPHGFKAMIVTPDRYACVQYKEELDKLLSPEASAVVISTTANDPDAFKKQWAMNSDQQEKLLNKFKDPKHPLQFLIVTAKLLTGFDAPVLQTMYLDKSLKDHTLLQAICRTNRLFPNKGFGRIVDYFGSFDDTAKALAFDEKTMQNVVTSMAEYKVMLPSLLAKALSHFPGVDRTLVGFEGLEAAQDCIDTNEKRDAFAIDYGALSKIWEALSPDPFLSPYRVDYKWLSQVYDSVRPAASDNGRLLWFALGAETTRLIHEHVHVSGVHDDMEEMVLNADVIDDLMNAKDPKKAKKLAKLIAGRLGRHSSPEFLALSERLEKVRARAEQGLISSIEFIKELCQLATETLQAEKNVEAPVAEQQNAKSALTELFLEIRTDKTPAIVERIVTDIDEIVRKVRFPSWQTTEAGKKLVRSELRKALLKYQLHKDHELFEKAYQYVEQYY
ncbi:HsdR family type I site-specific deoxyribonuclease [Hymenobacter busanensis]|uniref:Type I restriction enzyme endonuclease subunit n=1 Tax=Hymenobacter busanensis TaxID=2607656 RepID=A0A7L5A211_9BACT|nr:HsdR family type I site-specific deoxyribonuclease [Hymenobacter busanensis]KAA9338437.1 HsdR family type I site-specific deoxyribonuclease [Hymenobacter busanensis]QHJ09136.1 HsdR family type I site-specific deoxyribonuclease [Hymenobacter busanensis]